MKLQGVFQPPSQPPADRIPRQACWNERANGAKWKIGEIYGRFYGRWTLASGRLEFSLLRAHAQGKVQNASARPDAVIEYSGFEQVPVPPPVIAYGRLKGNNNARRG